MVKKRRLRMAIKRFTLRAKDLQRVWDNSLWKSVQIKEHKVDNHPVVDVHLTEDMLITALTIGVRIHQKANALNLIQTIEGGAKEDIIGIEGAFAVVAYLYENWLVSLDYVTIGKGDSGDVSFKGALMDVKTRSKKWHDTLMIPEKQWRKHKNKFDFYVGCNEIKEDWVRIWGYATKTEVAKIEPTDNVKGHPLPVSTRLIPFVNLNPIEKLKDLQSKIEGSRS